MRIDVKEGRSRRGEGWRCRGRMEGDRGWDGGKGGEDKEGGGRTHGQAGGVSGGA